MLILVIFLFVLPLFASDMPRGEDDVLRWSAVNAEPLRARFDKYVQDFAHAHNVKAYDRARLNALAAREELDVAQREWQIVETCFQKAKQRPQQAQNFWADLVASTTGATKEKPRNAQKALKLIEGYRQEKTECLTSRQGYYHEASAVQERQKADILACVLAKDEDYCPGKTAELVEHFMYGYWKNPPFNIGSAEFFSMFVQGFLVKMDANLNKEVCALGQKAAQGLERHVLDLKFSKPICVVALMNAVLSKVGDEGHLSSQELADVYRRLGEMSAHAHIAQRGPDFNVSQKERRRGETLGQRQKRMEQMENHKKNIKRAFWLGSSQAECFKEFWRRDEMRYAVKRRIKESGGVFSSAPTDM